MTCAKMGKISERKKGERGYLEQLSGVYDQVPKGRVISSESPDFILRTGRKRRMGLEFTRMTRHDEAPDPGGYFQPELSKEALTKVIRIKEQKLHLYRRKKLVQIWLVIVVDSFDIPDSFNIFNQITGWKIETDFDAVLLLDRSKDRVYEVKHPLL